MPKISENLQNPSVILPQITETKGIFEDTQNPSPSKEIASLRKIIYIDQSKNLDDADDGMNKPRFSGPGPLELRVLDEVPSDSENSDDAVEHVLYARQETPIEETIASLSFSDEVAEEDVSDTENLNGKQASFRTWVPARLPPYVNHRIAQRKIYRPGTAAHEPKRSIKIPVEINIFVEKVYGIIDSGSGRSFLSESAYNRVKQFQIEELTTDLTSRAGVCLGDKSVIKGLGG